MLRFWGTNAPLLVCKLGECGGDFSDIGSAFMATRGEVSYLVVCEDREQRTAKISGSTRLLPQSTVESTALSISSVSYSSGR